MLHSLPEETPEIALPGIGSVLMLLPCDPSGFPEVRQYHLGISFAHAVVQHDLAAAVVVFAVCECEPLPVPFRAFAGCS